MMLTRCSGKDRKQFPQGHKSKVLCSGNLAGLMYVRSDKQVDQRKKEYRNEERYERSFESNAGKNEITNQLTNKAQIPRLRRPQCQCTSTHQ
jgi:hypothetical protein